MPSAPLGVESLPPMFAVEARVRGVSALEV